MGRNVICVATSESQAIRIASGLKAAGFPQDEISVLFPDRTGGNPSADPPHTKTPQRAATGATAGGAIGAALGWLVGIGSLTVPGLGPFVVAGPIMVALSGAAAGAAVGGLAGGLAGGLVGLGVSQVAAERYETKLKKGNILLSVHCEDREQENVAWDIAEALHAEDITVASEAEVRSY